MGHGGDVNDKELELAMGAGVTSTLSTRLGSYVLRMVYEAGAYWCSRVYTALFFTHL